MAEARVAESARPNRAEQTRRERRMKPGDLAYSGIKLALDEGRLDRNTYNYRWVKEDRIRAMESQDWDLVDEAVKPDSTGAGTVQTVHGGIGEAGKPYGLVLMKKYRDWYEDDQERKQAPLDEVDRAIRRGAAHKTAGEAELTDAVTYTPGSGNSIEGVSFRK